MSAHAIRSSTFSVSDEGTCRLCTCRLPVHSTLPTDRICPGRYFAEAAVFINVAAALHVFDITPPVDDAGKPINIIPTMTDGILTYVRSCFEYSSFAAHKTLLAGIRKTAAAPSSHARLKLPS